MALCFCPRFLCIPLVSAQICQDRFLGPLLGTNPPPSLPPGQVTEEDEDLSPAHYGRAVAKPVCVNGTDGGGALNSKPKVERRSSSSSNPSRKGLSTASKIRKLSTCKQQ